MRRAFRTAAAIGLIFLNILAAAPALGQTGPVGPHVRTDDPTLRKLISRGLTESPTFKEIVCQIDQVNGLVHVVASQCGSLSGLAACLDHDVHVRGGIRYLRINMLPGEPETRQLPLLAHELQHALEVLSDESATSQESVARLYERIGVRRPGVGNFETDAALRVQKAVARELHTMARHSPALSSPPDKPAPPNHNRVARASHVQARDPVGLEFLVFRRRRGVGPSPDSRRPSAPG
jgi:hypothetical protein